MRKHFTILAILIPTLLAFGDSPVIKASRGRGCKTGSYTVKVVGNFNGDGDASVVDGALSISATVRGADGTAGLLVLTNAVLEMDHFSSKATIMGLPCTVDGRVDLPAATDTDTTDNQAFTGRLLGTVHDNAGRVSRILGIQAESSRGMPGMPGWVPPPNP